MTPDGELLRRYTETNSEDAFTELTRRHLDLVYSAALRQVNGDAHLAQDVAQSVFADLARKAAGLAGRQTLAGWLYTGAHYAAAKAVRAEQRRHTREQEAHAMQELLRDPGSNPDWETLRPVLDTAMHELDEADREVILLRYFENQRHADIGEQFGLGENAARMRVERALEKLRIVLARRGVATTAVALSAAVSANAVAVGPAGLATMLSTAALTGTTLTTAATATAIKTIAMTTLQKTLITVTIVAAVGTGIYEARQASTLRNEVQTLQQQQAPLAEQIQILSKDRDDATRQLAAMRDENERLGRNTPELLRLRGQVASLKADSQAEKANDQIVKTMGDWVSRATELKRHIEKMPGARIPEFQILSDIDWLDAVKSLKLDTDQGMASAVGQITEVAKEQFANQMSYALRKFIEANAGELPTQLAQLKPFFLVAVGDEVLERYEMLRSGNVKDVPERDRKCALISEKRFAADSTGHTMIQIGECTFQNLSSY